MSAYYAVALSLVVACMADKPAETMQWGEDAHVNLRGPSGQILTLQGDGRKSIQWAPVKKEALEVEVRVFIVDWGPNAGMPNEAPVVRWSMKYGHGKLTWNAPYLTPWPLGAGGQLFTDYPVPARGLVFRVNAREIELTLHSPAKLDASAPWPETKVQVSFQPTFGAQPPLFPRQHYCAFQPLPSGGIPFEPFPPEANEFRIFTAEGQPYTGGASNITFLTAGGLFLAAPSLDVGLWADYVPIPVYAIGWGVSFPLGPYPYPAGANYR